MRAASLSFSFETSLAKPDCCVANCQVARLREAAHTNSAPDLQSFSEMWIDSLN